MTASLTTDVLICGAGAAGLTLAIDLARRDVDVLLIDQAAHPFPGSRGKGIQPRSQEIFEDLGVLDRLAGLGGPYPPVRTYEDGGFVDSLVMEGDAPSHATPYGRPLMVPQFLTERVLRDRLAAFGAAPVYGCALTTFGQDEDGVTCTVTDQDGETTIRARYLIGADGGRSTVRRTLNVEFAGRALGVRAIVADIVLDGRLDEVWHRWAADPRRQVALCPLWGTGMFQLQAPIPMDGAFDCTAQGLTDFLAARTQRGDLKVKAVMWASLYNMSARLADSYRVDRTVLIGDAAHIHPPTGGQGLNTSVQDAYNLGWKLAAVLKGGPQHLLESYEGERRPVAADVLGFSTGLLDDAASGQAMRRGRPASQLDVGYPNSSVSLAIGRPDAGVGPGERAPDAPCIGAAGQGVRLFDLFRGPHWTLLELSPGTPLPGRPGLRVHAFGAGGDLIDNGGHFEAAYRLDPGDRVLIRPDGYVAAVVAKSEECALIAYLQDFLGTQPLAEPVLA